MEIALLPPFHLLLVFVIFFSPPFFFCFVVLLILSDSLSAVLFVWFSLSLSWSLQAFSLHRFNHFLPSLDLFFRTAPVMVCSTMQLWAEMLLVPHQSTSCPARRRRMCTAAWQNRSAPLGCFHVELLSEPLRLCAVKLQLIAIIMLVLLVFRCLPLPCSECQH